MFLLLIQLFPDAINRDGGSVVLVHQRIDVGASACSATLVYCRPIHFQVLPYSSSLFYISYSILFALVLFCFFLLLFRIVEEKRRRRKSVLMMTRELLFRFVPVTSLCFGFWVSANAHFFMNELPSTSQCARARSRCERTIG